MRPNGWAYRSDPLSRYAERPSHDALNRLTSAAVAGGPVKTFAYDAIGNLTYKSDVGAYTYPLPGAAPS